MLPPHDIISLFTIFLNLRVRFRRSLTTNLYEMMIPMNDLCDYALPGGRISGGTYGGTAARDRDRMSNPARSEEHTSELQSLMRISYAVFCLKKKQNMTQTHNKSLNS